MLAKGLTYMHVENAVLDQPATSIFLECSPLKDMLTATFSCHPYHPFVEQRGMLSPTHT